MYVEDISDSLKSLLTEQRNNVYKMDEATLAITSSVQSGVLFMWRKLAVVCPPE